MSLQIEIVTGSAADRLLAEDNFISQWETLYAACPWGTVLQTAGFARAWYTVYRPVFEPVLVLGHDADRQLIGLLAAGYAPRRGLVMAGATQAEYQTWLATPEQGDAFATSAFYALGRRYPSSALTLKYLPPGTPLEWLNGKSPVAKYCVLTPAPRPLMDLRDGKAIDKCLKRRNIRSRLNKLRNSGYAGIERITDPDHLARHFDEIIAWHDFRRVTVSGIGQFEQDPLKKPFHYEMLRQGVLCATVLKMRDDVISMQLDMVGRPAVHLALGAYAPWLSKFALGKIHILEVAQMLRADGFEWMDLTPGDDPYKAEFATQWDQVHTLTVSPGAASHRKAVVARKLDMVAREALRRIGSDPVGARIAARNLLSRPLATVVQPMQNVLRRWTSTSEKLSAYTISAGRLPLTTKGTDPKSEAIHFDSVADWLAYRPAGFEPHRHEGLSDATRHFAAGMQSYTMIRNGRLCFSCWLADQPTEVLTELGLLENFNGGATIALLLDIRTYGGDPTTVLAPALSQAARDAADRLKAGTVVVLVRNADRRVIAALEQIGFAKADSKMQRLEAAGRRIATTLPGWMSLTAALQAAGLG